MSHAAATPPVGFEPFHELNLCSNRLVEIQFPILIQGGITPLLIGKGTAPRVWLSSVVVQGDQRMFFQVVTDNVPRSPQVRVETTPGMTVIYHGDTVVCRVRETGPNTAFVTDLDLRPAGLNIHGDSNALFVGPMEHSFNVMRKAVAFLNIG